MLRIIKIITLGVVFATAIIAFTAFSPGPLTKEKVVILKKNSIRNISKLLYEENIIYDQKTFWLLAQVMNHFDVIQAGEYKFIPKISIFSIIRQMQIGNIITRKIVVPEGYTTKQIIDIVQNEEKLSNDITTIYGEGDLLPETYFYIYGDSREEILKRMHKKMQDALEFLWESNNNHTILKNKKEALILASIVEKEAKNDEDRRLVASVFLNRLKKNMKLDADPTVIYAITKGKYILEKPLTRKDLKIKSPFNTYKYRGLPPTPISNPGIASLKSVLNPLETKYLYFVVSDCKGNHNFASNIKEHNKNVNKYRKLKCAMDSVASF